MPSANYRLLEQAMRKRRPVVCIYGGHPRAICPIILGHTDGAEKALTYQFEEPARAVRSAAPGNA